MATINRKKKQLYSNKIRFKLQLKTSNKINGNCAPFNHSMIKIAELVKQ